MDISDRTQKDVQLLVSYFKEIKCFKELNFKNSELMKVIAQMKTQFIPKHTIIFNIGDYGDCFYITIHGSNMLYLPNPEISACRISRKELENQLNDYQELIDRLKMKANDNDIPAKLELGSVTLKHTKVQKQITRLENYYEKLDEMVPIVTLGQKIPFGEQALLKGIGRAGTVITLEDCHMAVVEKDSYEKLIKRAQQAKSAKEIQFLRQIPFISHWLVREVNGLYLYMKEESFANKGTYIAQEGEKVTKFFVIKQGEVEIVKKDFKQVFFNEETGVIGVTPTAGSKQQEMLKSNNAVVPKEFFNPDFKKANTGGAKIHDLNTYTGSLLQQMVQSFLNAHVNSNMNFLDKQRSKFNQYSIREGKVTVLGAGQTWGDIDKVCGRNCLYSVRTASRDTVI